jgi:hypothetical protein
VSILQVVSLFRKVPSIIVRSSTAVFSYHTKFIKLLHCTFGYPVIRTLLDPQKPVQESRCLTLSFTCSELLKFAACKICRMTQCPVTFTARSVLRSQFASPNVLEVCISTVQHRTNIICKTLTALCHVCCLIWLC